MPKGFAARLAPLMKDRSPLCLGLDPSAELLAAWGLDDDAEGLRRFCGTVLEAAADRLAVIKPQAGFFERLGPAGTTELARVLGQIRAQGSLSLVDAKRGDFAETMAGYAQAWLGAGSGFGGDAMTVSAYLGFEALRPVFDRAVATASAVFVVVRSSNPEGAALQRARHADGRTIAERLADEITAFNAGLGDGVGPIGAVVGATLDPAAILARLPLSPILAPGVGAQGATLAEVGSRFAGAAGRTLPSASRSILGAGPSVAALREAIERHRDEAWAVLGAPLGA